MGRVFKAIQRRSTKFLRGVEDVWYSLVKYQSIKLIICNHLTVGIGHLYRQKTDFPHPLGMVIGGEVRIGRGCIIYQNVTIGAKTNEEAVQGKYPRIGNNVIIGAGALIIGDISIGDNVYVGAGSVVTKDVAENSVVVGNPARVIRNHSLGH